MSYFFKKTILMFKILYFDVLNYHFVSFTSFLLDIKIKQDGKNTEMTFISLKFCTIDLTKNSNV